MSWAHVRIIAYWCTLSLYLFTLPILSRVLNPLVAPAILNGWNKTVCATDVSQLQCEDGRDSSQLAMEQGYTGGLICGGQEGLFGQATCATRRMGYSLSGFLATAPATGGLVMCTTFLFVKMWNSDYGIHIIVESSDTTKNVSWWALAVFQLCFCVWLVFPSVVLILMHNVLLPLWIVPACVHYITIAVACYKRSSKTVYDHRANDYRRVCWIVALMIFLGVFSIGVLSPICQFLPLRSDMNIFLWFWSTYGFWFWESFSLSLLFGVVPCIYLFTNLGRLIERLDDDDIVRELMTRCINEGLIVSFPQLPVSSTKIVPQAVAESQDFLLTE